MRGAVWDALTERSSEALAVSVGLEIADSVDDSLGEMTNVRVTDPLRESETSSDSVAETVRVSDRLSLTEYVRLTDELAISVSEMVNLVAESETVPESDDVMIDEIVVD